MKCKYCIHYSGYHGYTLKKIKEDKYKCPCKIIDCNCKDFEFERELK